MSLFPLYNHFVRVQEAIERGKKKISIFLLAPSSLEMAEEEVASNIELFTGVFYSTISVDLVNTVYDSI